MQNLFPAGGKSIRLDSHIPKDASGATPAPAILFVHGSGGNTHLWLEGLTPLLAPAGIAAFAVHYFDRTGTTRADLLTITDGVHVPLWLDTIHQALLHIAKDPRIDPTRIALVGVSLGAFLSLALATFPAPPAIKALIDISGGLVPPYNANATSAFPPTLMLHGDADTVVTISHSLMLDDLLTELNVPHEFHPFAGEGHWFSEHTQYRILAYIIDFLERML